MQSLSIYTEIPDLPELKELIPRADLWQTSKNSSEFRKTFKNNQKVLEFSQIVTKSRTDIPETKQTSQMLKKFTGIKEFFISSSLFIEVDKICTKILHGSIIVLQSLHKFIKVPRVSANFANVKQFNKFTRKSDSISEVQQMFQYLKKTAKKFTNTQITFCKFWSFSLKIDSSKDSGNISRIQQIFY